MLVSYKWLQDYVDLNGVTPEELADRITNAGIEVEHLDYPGKGLEKIVIGQVRTCDVVPEAPKLHLCQVAVGTETLQIVCGAPNVAAGQKVPVALPGATIGGGKKIERTMLHGKESNGMICALSELGVDNNFVPKEYADGIYYFDSDVPVGADALPYLNLDDAILDLDILVSSAHCMNMIGIAYEVGAILDRPVHLPQPQVAEVTETTASRVRVAVDPAAADKVPYYGARMIEDIKIAPAPRWLQLRLIASGVRPINNVVDIANYVMLEYGQPLHTFDYDAFGSDQVYVRLANENEQAVTLDDQARTLRASDLLITNGKTPAAIAGVMGGESSEVRLTTTRVLLEAAIFDPITVRKTSAHLGLRTDASSRYEKKVDRNRVVPAANRAADLLSRYADGKILGGMVEVGSRTEAETVIQMPWQKINAVLGSDLPYEKIVGILERLDFSVERDRDQIVVTVPSRRFDVSIPEDLVEEVGRIYGYAHISATLPEGTTKYAGLTSYQRLLRRTENLMEGMGLSQAYTYSLTTLDKAAAFTVHESLAPSRVDWPMSEEHEGLRESIVPQLIDVIHYHNNRQMPDAAFYEMGKVFIPQDGTVRPAEEEHLAGVVTGHLTERSWEGEARPVDFYTVKGLVESFFEMLGVSGRISYRPNARKGLHPGQTADVWFDDHVIGYIGALHPQVLKAHDLNETFVFELEVESLLRGQQAEIVYHALPRFPSMSRDIALVVKKTVLASSLEKVIRENGGELLQQVHLFDVYQGNHVASDEKSLAFSLVYFDPERTLTDDEVSVVHTRILDACKEKCGAVLRG
ncbi:phenylalanine--tRNA ligase subunit beta [Sporolactobacillus spathodeae]|uniref:Phenylalanine--tRNA ligase beta subunit n=1 Tax=Sporolactobacillus spathodeae TaxID=1465502 RepID=A0ABS2Q889_9BACL|nr:phenylalanine--tRNA ligase subunit beta [Sporolactobacillus spathodeae]MBM7658007.1 phenylalanyl-tRNA synthetase beta chain [Sporolactobacillus spathodeae]